MAKQKQAVNIPKGVRDVEVYMPGVLKIRKGTGILTVGLTGLSVVGVAAGANWLTEKIKDSVNLH